jgi:ribonuclease HII
MSARTPGLAHEYRLRAQGLALVAGLDEAGRGAWAGPVAAAAVILPLDRPDLLHALDGVRDSKLLTARRREALYEAIMDVAISAAAGLASAREVEELNVVGATRLAMGRALASLAVQPDALLIDGRYMRLRTWNVPQHTMSRGEHASLSIAAASVIAKVSRDRLMVGAGQEYPDYGFDHHKGYGTQEHRAALVRLGPCDLHRRTFGPIMQRLDGMGR